MGFTLQPGERVPPQLPQSRELKSHLLSSPSESEAPKTHPSGCLFRLSTQANMMTSGAAIMGLTRPLTSCHALILLESLIPLDPVGSG